MQSMTFNEVTGNLSAVMDKVNDDHEPLLVTREDNTSIVLMSLDDFNALQETDDLTRSLVNAEDAPCANAEIRTHRHPDRFKSSQGPQMAAILQRMADRNALSQIDDPAAWQREIRHDRPLADRD